ncbi:MAG: DUF3089 domain-containing protein [Solirubrobacteraceae bacterium]|nr:DUF3089 domain-containing protein [Solirubrobacteraceae bacterium]
MSRFVAVSALLCAVGLALPGAAGAAVTPSPDTVWGCFPGATPNPCEGSLATTTLASTTIQPRRVARVETPAPDADRSIDCFYVYPTVVTSASPSAPKRMVGEVRAIYRYQAARFSQVCKVYAPIYRQATLSGITTPVLQGESAQTQEQTRRLFDRGYGDVLGAWRDYLAHHNAGRGVVLIGHSQGSGMLIRLLREEIDPDPAQRARLVSAIVAGGNLTVRTGARIGGDLQHIPTCATGSETGCVMAWSLFGELPSRTAVFGHADSSLRDSTGLPTTSDTEVACVNPAQLSGDGGRLRAITRTEPFPGAVGLGLQLMFYGLTPRASTPWVAPGERYTAGCVRNAGAHVLRVRAANAATIVPFPSPYPDWGLHLADLNLPLGNLIDVVRSERAAWAARG